MQLRIRQNYISKENTDCLKGLFAVAVVLCHIYGRRPFGASFGIGVLFTALGYLSVAAFLFFSGYGLTVSYQSKGATYLNGFLKKRVLPTYIVQAFLIIVYTVFNLCIGIPVSQSVILQSFFFGKTVVVNGWYIQAIIVFYLLFYIVCRISGGKYMSLFMTIGIVGYVLICALCRLPSTWYEASFAFLCGIEFAQNKDKIDSAFMKMPNTYIATLLTAIVLLCVTFLFGNAGILPLFLKIPLKMLSAVCFVVCMLLTVMKVKINFPPVRFIGKYYFEIYILQGIYLVVFDKVFVMRNGLLYGLSVGISTFLTALCVHPLIQYIYRICRNTLKD